MVQKVKQFVQNKLNNARYQKHIAEVERQKDCYRQWYLQTEGWKKSSLPMAKDDIVLFADADGILEEKAAEAVGAFWQEHPYVQIAYADEDCLDENGVRVSPWFKPEWSPDTLDSFQYFGHVFAIRADFLNTLNFSLGPKCLKQYEEWKNSKQPENENEGEGRKKRNGEVFILRYEESDQKAIYEMLLALTQLLTEMKWIAANDSQKAIMPIGKVLLHMKKEKRDLEVADIFENIDKELHAMKALEQCKVSVSVIIPSKDNPQVLETCISSFREKTMLEAQVKLKISDTSLANIVLEPEIIVVDNGSNDENKAVLEKLAEKYQFKYLYQPMNFNFSKMCNLGICHSSGDYFLLLNDDMEIIQPDWLIKLAQKAILPHAGAVGAKLLYPNSDIIQHIGITNIKVGPVHKLLKQHDENSLYHSQNRHIYDMIGVTAACLMVKRSKYEQAGGLYEEMAVAYNDVELNFSLYENGYYNIFRGDVVLFHHESLSRGDDNLSDEKWLRLLQEKDILYSRHPKLKSFDPFYSRNLAVHSNLYLPNFMYDYEKRDYYTKVRAWKKCSPEKWENGCLIVNVEHAREEKKLEFTERDDVYWIEGWSYILGLDNCRFRRSLILQSEDGKLYEAEVLNRYRKDVVEILPQQQNVELAGFTCRIPKDALAEGTYTISMLAKDTCSNQRLYQKTDRSFTIGRVHE